MHLYRKFDNEFYVTSSFVFSLIIEIFLQTVFGNIYFYNDLIFNLS